MEGKVDWRSVYDELMGDGSRKAEFRGLRNRKRIWKVVEELAEECWKEELK
jgi:hypothetical protein